MKHILVFSVAALLCVPSAVHASAIGGAETLGQGKLSVGLDQEFVFDRDGKTLTQEVSGFSFTSVRSNYEIDMMYRTTAKVSYGLLDGLDIYTRLGVANPEYTVQDTLIFDTGTNKDTWKYKGRNAFAYGLGMKGTYSLENGWLIGADAQYLRHKNNYKATGHYAEYLGDTLIDDGPLTPKTGKITFYQWHVAPYVAVQLGNWVPYLGARYSDARIQEKHTYGYTVRSRPKYNVGAFVGTDVTVKDSWSVNIEGRFIDETAMSVGGTFKF